jgi:DNA polymerase-3 subunit gamma/tau
MENFLVSARKYRPDTFNTVVGQTNITSTLKSAIRSGHLAHAYLFCGPRGVGKTTCARILAKTINCTSLGEEAEPCNQCESCQTFNTSRSFNIHELDAASNNSVDDIRNLIDSVRIIPQSGKYSVYIIDEVHMLSQSAFNAFLKTLEEPPSHAIFILATTEKHKIIPTILSRCQIYDFNRIRVEDMVEYLKTIASKEGVEAEEEALQIIALKADGAMRDALTIFDQLVSFSQNRITYKGVIENLNVLDYEYYFNISDCFLNHDASKALLIFNEVLQKGFEGQNFVGGLAGHMRDLMVSRDPVTLQLLEAVETVREKYIEQARKCDPDFLYRALDILNQCEISYKSGRNQRLHVEIALIRLSNLRPEKKNLTDNPTEILQIPVPGNTGSAPEKKLPSGALITKPPAVEEVLSKKEIREVKEEPVAYHRKVATISIKNALQGLEKNGKEDPSGLALSDPENDPGKNGSLSEKPIVEDFMIKCWNSYAEAIHNEKPRFSSALKKIIPVIKANHILEISFNNQAQLDAFNSKLKADMEQFLRRELQHPDIRIESALLPTDKQNRKLYTGEEKLAYLSEKNPVLNKFKHDLGLELE